jgi:hypothetical protein
MTKQLEHLVEIQGWQFPSIRESFYYVYLHKDDELIVYDVRNDKIQARYKLVEGKFER